MHSYHDPSSLEAEAYREQSMRSLEQAARNLLMSIGEGVQHILTDLVEGAVEEAMDIEVLRELICKAVDAYLAQDGRENRTTNHHVKTKRRSTGKRTRPRTKRIPTWIQIRICGCLRSPTGWYGG